MGIDREPPVCHDVQGDIMTKRKPAAVVVAVWSGWFIYVYPSLPLFVRVWLLRRTTKDACTSSVEHCISSNTKAFQMITVAMPSSSSSSVHDKSVVPDAKHSCVSRGLRLRRRHGAVSLSSTSLLVLPTIWQDNYSSLCRTPHRAQHVQISIVAPEVR